jgi:hypothetical protein
MMRVITCLVMLLGFMPATVSVAYAQDCGQLCKRPTESELVPEHVVIDANTGDPIGGRTRFPQTDRVQILFVNKNPFKYVYRFDVLTTSLEESIIKDGLKLLGVKLPQAPAPGVEGSPHAFNCDADVEAEKSKYDDAAKAALTSETQLLAVIKNYQTSMDKYDDFIKLTDDDKLDCAVSCEAGKNLVPELDRLIGDFATVDAGVDSLEKAVQKARAAETALREAVKAKLTDEAKRTTCAKSIDDLDDPLVRLEKRLTQYKVARDRAKENKDRFEQLRKLIQSLTTSSFTETRSAVTTGPSEVKVTLYRRNIREQGAKEEQVGTPLTLRVGESRFSVSGGIGWSSINAAKVVRQLAPNPDDKNATIEVFGEEGKSRILPQVVALLNSRLGGEFNLFRVRSLPASFAWSLGAVVVDTTDSSGISYMTGPSILLNDNAFVVTLAYQSSRVERLASGFQLGQKIPADIKGALPTEKKREDGIMVAITYRTR